MTEGRETPGGDPPRKAEGDLLAERRARRAAEYGEPALTRRAEAAEATVRTLEAHVASLQRRLSEAEEERARIAEASQAEQVSLAIEHQRSAGEAELRRVKQREYAEQQLRVEAEERYLELERESRAEIDRLGRALAASERAARELSERLESVQRELAEAEQVAGAERAEVKRLERELQARLTDLERRALEVAHDLASERTARERAERLLASMRDGCREAESLVRELKGILASLRIASTSPPPITSPSHAPDAPPGAFPSPPRPLAQAPWAGTRASDWPEGRSAKAGAARPSGSPGEVEALAGERGLPADLQGQSGSSEQARSGEMAEALAAAVARLRARVEAIAEEPSGGPGQPAPDRPSAAGGGVRAGETREHPTGERPGFRGGGRRRAERAGSTVAPVGSMSPSSEPLAPTRLRSWWSAWRARRRRRSSR